MGTLVKLGIHKYIDKNASILLFEVCGDTVNVREAIEQLYSYIYFGLLITTSVSALRIMYTICILF